MMSAAIPTYVLPEVNIGEQKTADPDERGRPQTLRYSSLPHEPAACLLAKYDSHRHPLTPLLVEHINPLYELTWVPPSTATRDASISQLGALGLIMPYKSFQ